MYNNLQGGNNNNNNNNNNKKKKRSIPGINSKKSKGSDLYQHL